MKQAIARKAKETMTEEGITTITYEFQAIDMCHQKLVLCH